MRAYVVTVFLALIIAMGLEGCGSCRKKADGPSPEAPPAPAGPQAAPAPPVPGTPPPVEAPAPPPVPEPRASGKTRLVADILARPASFWNLSPRQHVILRARTVRMLQVPPEVANPMEFPPLSLAALDLTEGGGPGEFFDPVVQQLYERLYEQKVFTAAAPVVVFWEPFVRASKPRWSVAVPVADDTQVKPPLRLVRIPATRIHAERLAVKEAKKFVEPVPSQPGKKPSVFEISRIAVTNMRKKVSLTVQPSYVMVRLPDLSLSPTGPDSVFEVLFVEERPAPPAETPTPATAAPSSP